MAGPEDVFRELIADFSAGEHEKMRPLLADDIVAYITNSEGGVDRVDGPDGYLARVPTGTDATYSVDVTQVVTVAPDQVLGMVEVKAERKGKTLHNHAAFLARIPSGQVTELWMVEALPAYSDEFWS